MTILALDVDGVINALPPRTKSGAAIDPLPEGWRDGEAVANGMVWPIRYDPGLGAKLLALAQQTGAELTWLTTWEQDANLVISPLVGLPSDLPVVELAPGRRGMKFSEYRRPGLVKALALKEYQPGREVLWIDDDTTGEDLHDAMLEHRVSLLHINGRYGLQDKHLEIARRWLSLGS